MRRPILFILGLALAASASAPASAARHHHPAAGARAPAAAISQPILRAQLLLDRAGFSPGTIDGRPGANLDGALHAFQAANGLPVGRLDDATSNRLVQVTGGPDILARYTIAPQDVEGPFVANIPQDFAQMAQLPRLAYRGPRQLLAEKFHMSEKLLEALNPGANFAAAGTTIAVAGVQPMPADPRNSPPGEGVGSTERQPNAARVVVDKRSHAVLVYAADNRLLAFFPASIGSPEKPAPSGRLAVRSVAYEPTYTYNPAYAFKGQTAKRAVEVAPGPNSPVGLVWIGLSEKGYGIHGTADPDAIGKAQSHGCVRLTNWDAVTLAHMVRPGTPIDFVG